VLDEVNDLRVLGHVRLDGGLFAQRELSRQCLEPSRLAPSTSLALRAGKTQKRRIEPVRRGLALRARLFGSIVSGAPRCGLIARDGRNDIP